MAQYITLEEAAQKLGMPVDEFKRRLKLEWTHLVPMRDGPTLRFRMNQVEELARQLGGASDQGLPLASLKSDVEPGSEDFQILANAGKSKQQAEEPLLFDSSSEDDVFSLSAEAPKSGSGRSGKHKSDSDVRIEERSDKDAAVVPTEEIALDISGPGSAVIKGGSSAKLSAPKSSAKLTPPDSGKKLSSPDLTKGLSSSSSGDSSEFELSLDADSDDFELQMSSDSSAEVELGSSPVEEKSAGKSGVNLRAPSDSGISLERGKKGSSGRHGKKPDSDRKTKPDLGSDSDLDFELSLEPDSGEAPPLSGKKSTPAKSSPRVPVTSDSDSEFELTLDDSGEGSSLEAAAVESDEESKGDIFETDFEIPPMSDESGSEAVALDSDTDLEEQSEVELALEEGDVSVEDETGSQVVLLEDEDEAPTRTPSGRRRKPSSAVDLADVEEEESVGSALQGVRGRRRDEEEEEEEEEEMAGAGRAAAPAAWGAFPAVVLIPTFFLVLLGTLTGFEILHTMVGYQQPSQAPAPIVRGIAGNLDMELRDQ
jgi:hypothetical protein